MIIGGYNEPVDQRVYTADDSDESHVSISGSLWNRLSFDWLYSVIELAQKRPLQETDVTKIPSSCDATGARKKLWAVWSHKDTYGDTEQKELLQAIIEIYGIEYAFIGVYLFFASALTFVGPVILHRLVMLASDQDSSIVSIIMCAFWLFLSRLIAAILNTQYTFQTGVLSVKVGAAIKGCLFEKILRLSTKARRSYTTGMLSNLYTTDVERVTDMVVQGHRFWALPLQILVSMALLFTVVSYAMFYGLLTVLIILLINNYVAKLSKAANDRVQAAKDTRMSAVGACFSSSLIIKLNVWENQFIEKILAARNEELVHVWTALYIAAVNICLLWLAPCLVSSVTIAAYGSSGDVHAAEIFTALSLFKSLQDPFRDLPGIITQYFQMKTSLERLQVLFNMPEKKVDTKMNQSIATEFPNIDIHINSCTFSWDTDLEYIPTHILEEDKENDEKGEKLNDDSTKQNLDKSTGGLLQNEVVNDQLPNELKDDDDYGNNRASCRLGYRLVVPFSISVQNGDLVVVKGTTGSGKSSFISALLGDMYLADHEQEIHAVDLQKASETDGKAVNIRGTMSYASQLAWIQNGSVLDNILMGLPLEPQKLQRVIDACALGPDLHEWSDGLQQHIGERGIGLSGGQKARVALARCMYSDADVYVLDDVFAALDTMVCRHIFEKAILQLLRGKTVVLVTHNMDILNSSAVDSICQVDDGVVTLKKLHQQPSDRGVHRKQSRSMMEIPYIFDREEFDVSTIEQSYTSLNESGENNTEVTIEQTFGVNEEEGDEEEKYRIERNHSFFGRPHISSTDDEDENVPSSEVTQGSIGAVNSASLPFATEARDIPKCVAYNSKTNQKGKTNLLSEERAEGNISSDVYWGYLNALGGFKVVAFLCFVQLCWQGLGVGSDIWLSIWTSHSDDWQKAHIIRNILIYTTLSVASGLTVFIRTYTISSCGYQASKSIFERMTHAVLHAPMAWIDVNPSGRILNRFSDDVSKIDLNMPFAVGSCFATIFNLLGSILTVAVITKWLVFVSIPIAYIYVTVMKQYIRASREIQRMQQMSVSPVLSFMAEICVGSTIVNAFDGANQRFIDANDEKVNKNSQMLYAAQAAQAWFVIRVQVCGSFLLFFIVLFAFVSHGQLSSSGNEENSSGNLGASLIGLSLSYGLAISDELIFVVMILSWFENSMVSPERVLQYCDIKSEGTEYQKSLYRSAFAGADFGSDSDIDENKAEREVPPMEEGVQMNPLRMGGNEADGNARHSEWITKGSITYENVFFRYQPTSEDILNNLNFTINGGEKIGIVGRTGSGKSSLSMSLFRVAELSSGKIIIDGTDISSISLNQLRSGIEIIPQNPVILKGTVRMNVDPFHCYTDSAVYEALEKTQMLKSVVKLAEAQVTEDDSTDDSSSELGDKALNTDDFIFSKTATGYGVLHASLDENGGNLSVGEKQLLVMARALLSNAKILILDEATASVDGDTDVAIRMLLEREFRESTVITIAHRLHTVMNSDKVIVMDRGCICEFDSPKQLLQTSDSIFSQLVAAEKESKSK